MTLNLRRFQPAHATYWLTTLTIALSFFSGGMACLAGSDQQVLGMTELGYPRYFVTMLGAWKVLGAIVLVTPRLSLLKEWAYAGIVFDLLAASISHVAVGHTPGKAIVPLVYVCVTAISWSLRPADRRLTTTLPCNAVPETLVLHTR